MYRAIFVIVAVVTVGPSAQAQQVDTLRPYAASGPYAFYSDPAVTMQAARFDLPAPGIVEEIRITLGGAAGSATVRLFGAEAAAPAPLQGHDLIAPVRVTKTAGIHRISIPLSEPVRCDRPQFFVAIDSLTAGVTLLSDTRPRSPACANAIDDAYYAQCLMLAGGGWRWGRYTYAIDAVVRYPQRATPAYLADATEAAGLARALSGSGTALGDIDGNGTVDIVAGGRLYLNDGRARFADATESSGLRGSPAANIVLDADNDLDLDILFVPGGERCVLFVNDGTARFTPKPLTVAAGRPASYAVGDINGDGRLDVFIGVAADSAAADSAAADSAAADSAAATSAAAADASRSGGSMLLAGDGARGFADSTAMLGGDGVLWCELAQMVDFDNDGRLDLHIVSGGPSGSSAPDRFWRQRAPGLLEEVGAVAFGRRPAGANRFAPRAVGAAWADYDNDGAMDLLRPALVPIRSAHEAAPGTNRDAANPGGALRRGVLRADVNGSGDLELAEGEPIALQAGRAAGSWADFDNDGLLDYLLTTSSGCRYAELFTQAPGGVFVPASFAYGLFRAAIGPDAALADMNDDGRIDVVTFADGHLRLFLNTRPRSAESNFLALTLAGPHAAGARVTLWAGGVRFTRDATCGRGRLIQEPARLHFGLGAARSVDSAIVRWGNGSAERLRDLEINTIATVREGSSASAGTNAARIVSAGPNPFDDAITIRYSIGTRGYVSLGIYTLDGALVAQLADAVADAGEHTATWEGRDAQGLAAPQGVYVYRLRTAGAEVSGKAVLAR